MGDVGLEALVRAIHLLHGASSLEERSAADKWLRRWQISPEAWDNANRLLSEPSATYEVQLTAAIALRTKLLYDFVQLPSTAHEALCSSLLNHIENFKHSSNKAVLRTLALAFADLSIHTCRAWPTFLDILHARLSRDPVDTPAWLCCLKALSEENGNKSLLVDPVDQKAHADILAARLPWVTSQIICILHAPDTSASMALEALECFVQWATFASEVPSFRQTTLFSTVIIDMCFKLVQSSQSGQDVSDRVAECLSQIIWLASKRPEAHDAVLNRTLEELATPNGCIRNALVAALEADDGETALSLARIYRYACCGSYQKLAVLFWRGEPLIKELLGILLRLSSVPFDLEDEARGSNGIATTVLTFWDRFVTQVACQRDQLKALIQDGCASFDCNGASGNEKFGTGGTDLFALELLPSGARDPASFKAIVAEHDVLFDLLFQTLIQQCFLPEDALRGTSAPHLYEYYRFRGNVLDTLLQLRHIYTKTEFFARILRSLMRTSTTGSVDPVAVQRAQEAHLSCLQQLLREKWFIVPTRNGVSKLLSNERSGSTTHSEEGAGLVDIFESLTAVFRELSAILLPTPPSTILECLTRTAAVEVLSEAAQRSLIDGKTEGIQKILEGLGQQVFHSDLCDGQGNHVASQISTAAESDAGPESNMGSLLEFRRTLTIAASDALCQLCVSSEDTALTEYLLRQLYPALHRFPNLYPRACFNILEGLAIIVSTLPLDADFLHWSGQLLKPCTTALASTQDIREMCLQLDRLAVLFRGLLQKKRERREVLGQFLMGELWPLIERIWEAQPQSGCLVECCGRAMKHAMRCVWGDVFKVLLPSFTSSIIANAKRCLHSTYIYVVEWLVTEYCDDSDVRPILKLLFEELSEIGFKTLQAQSKGGELLDPNLIEDCFGMFSRSLRFCPALPGNSKTLPEVFTVVYPCLHHSNRIAVEMACTFLKNAAYILRTCEHEEGCIAPDQDETVVSAEKNIETLMETHLGPVTREIFYVMNELPTSHIISVFASTLSEYRKAFRPAEFRQAVREGIHCLPAAVIATENFKDTVIHEIMEGDIEAQMQELYARCRRVNLRQREAEAGETNLNIPVVS